MVAVLILQFAIWWLNGSVRELAVLYNSEFSLSGLPLDGALGLLIVAVAMGWAGAWLAVRRHLDAIEPGEIAGLGSTCTLVTGCSRGLLPTVLV